MNRITSGLTTATISVNEFEKINDKLARVIVTCTGSMTQDQATLKMVEQFGECATPVRGSFRWLNEGTHALGFVSLTPQTRLVDDKKQLSKYRALASNLYMDDEDETLWELKSGVGGQYLTRQGSDDLAGVLSRVSRASRGSTPRMASVVSAGAKPHEFVAFVNGSDMDYGFCVGSAKDGRPVILSHSMQAPVAVNEKVIVAAAAPEAEQFELLAHKGVKMEKANLPDVNKVIEYYRKAYFYSPPYLEKVMKVIQDHAAL